MPPRHRLPSAGRMQAEEYQGCAGRPSIHCVGCSQTHGPSALRSNGTGAGDLRVIEQRSGGVAVDSQNTETENVKRACLLSVFLLKPQARQVNECSVRCRRRRHTSIRRTRNKSGLRY